MLISTNDRGVDVAVLINLCAAHKAHIHVAALEVVRKNIVHAHYRERSAYECWIANRKWQVCRFCANHTCFIDHYQIWRVCSLREITGEIRLTDSDKHYIAISQ